MSLFCSQRRDSTTLKSKQTLISLFPALSLALALMMAFGIFMSQSAQAKTVIGGKPYYLHISRHISAVPNTGAQLAHWSSSFKYGGHTYSYTMVGTNPSSGSITTTVPTILIPLKTVFSDGTYLSGSGQVSNTKNSPIFQSASYSSGNTQYGDAMQRGEFWKTVSQKAPNYHVLLASPTVTSTVTLNVPAADGFSGYTGNGTFAGEIDVNWFDAHIQSMLTSHGIAPNKFPIFLSSNIFLYSNGNPNDCCILGYHSAANTSLGVQSYSWGSYLSPGIFTGTEDITALSHEVAEWYNDPFVNNTVPSWSVPSQPQYGCSSMLEVGDPLAGVDFQVTTKGKAYHPQDIAFFSWFARQAPSIGINGKYTYLGSFSTYSPSC